ncbi:MAG TPA: hypothetical protein VGO56_03750 [Pyrinomonadaceae bacterium]|jgi:hypothetical protein|nr:hypothetical protein [Pyrinomonadaceae bacterium]
MSVKESSATALIRFTGLGIICFSQERQRGEIGVIRDNKHSLSIRVQRPVFQEGGGSDVIVYQDIAAYEKLPKDDVQIEIKSLGQAAGYEIYQSGDFDRLDSPDLNDFRWIVNVSELHTDTTLAKAAERSHPLTKISIGNGLYYTHKLDTNLFFEKVKKDESGKAARREAFGNVGETIGVKLEGDVVSFTIRIGEKEETHTLKRVEGLPFKIEIKNMDYSENAVYSDMADYYTYVSSPDGTQFDLAPVVEDSSEAATGGAVNQTQFCHPIVVNDPPGIE